MKENTKVCKFSLLNGSKTRLLYVHLIAMNSTAGVLYTSLLTVCLLMLQHSRGLVVYICIWMYEQ